MKLFTDLLRILLVTTALAPLVSFAKDEPGVERWKSDKTITSFTAAKKVVPGDLVTMKCKPCKGGVNVTGNYGDPTGKDFAMWHALGAKQSCSECKGVLTVSKGKDADDLKINCSECGDDTVTCTVAHAEKS